MKERRDRILVVESDPDVGDQFICRTLRPIGYEVKWVKDADTAIQEVSHFHPHLVVTNLSLPGLSGKDLIVALSGQGFEVPIIVISASGGEKDVIQAFRLGATDFIRQPLREAELVSVVERALKNSRERRERERLSQELKQTNWELERRVRELTTIIAIGKAVTSITNQKTLFERIVEGGMYVTDADSGWVLVREDKGPPAYYLVAQRNLPKEITDTVGKPWEDKLSLQVIDSGVAMSVHDERVASLGVEHLGAALLVLPIKAKSEVIGILGVARKLPRPFRPSDQTVLEAVSDYASISIVNSRLFRTLEERAEYLKRLAESAKTAERIKDEILQNVSHELRTPLVTAMGYIDMFVEGEMGEVVDEQSEALKAVQEKLRQVVDMIQAMTSLDQVVMPDDLEAISLNDLTQEVVGRFETLATEKNIKLAVRLPSQPVLAFADRKQISRVLDELITNAIKFSPDGGKVLVAVEYTTDNLARVCVKDQGIGIEADRQQLIFDRFYQVDGSMTRKQGGLGIGLAMVKNIVTAHGGQVWVESKPGKGSAFYFTLLPPGEIP
ncbi:MAG: ATP-binding protein [Chloroflexota bacterium]